VKERLRAIAERYRPVWHDGPGDSRFAVIELVLYFFGWIVGGIWTLRKKMAEIDWYVVVVQIITTFLTNETIEHPGRLHHPSIC
jgi:hypothetical protein